MKKFSGIICGIDEAGRGALAGPLVGAAVILTNSQYQKVMKSGLQIKDSKILSPLQREKIYKFLIYSNIYFQTENIPVSQIDKFGIGWSNRKVMRKLISRSQADIFIIDGKIHPGKVSGVPNNLIIPIVDADATELSAILAGNVAKYTRDFLMKKLHLSYPIYNWQQNKGYGTHHHIEVISKYGVTKHHRQLFVDTALSNYQKIIQI